MSMELLTAAEILNKALGGIVAVTAGGGAKVLWQKIKNRLQKDNSLEPTIAELEQNPTQENLKLLEAFLQVEMHRDKIFAEEISKLAREIAQANSGDTIEQKEFEAKDNATVVGKAKGNQLFFGETHIHEKK